MSEHVDAEIVESQELERYNGQSPAPANLFGVSEPEQVIARAEKVASALKDVLDKQQLTKTISGKEHVLVSGWTLLGAMLGVFPVCVWTRKLENGWEARVEAQTRSGEVVGAAEAMCTRDESLWKTRDEYALRSMAQTRATSKAMRQPLGFVVTLAGYDETPAEEIPKDGAAASAGADGTAAPKITDAQHRKIGVLLKQLDEEAPPAEGQLSWVAELRERFRVVSRKDMTKQQASEAIEWLGEQLEAAKIPFG